MALSRYKSTQSNTEALQLDYSLVEAVLRSCHLVSPKPTLFLYHTRLKGGTAIPQSRNPAIPQSRNPV
jgi:hypothetical protein